MHRRPGAMEMVDEDETKLYEVKKHIFGIVIIYIQSTFGMILAIGLAYLLIPSVIEDTNSAFTYATLFSGASVLLALIVIVISTVIYRQNRIIVTDRNITQVLQYGLFSRKVSQLNIVNVEDVTSVQNGLLPTMLNYGTLKIETAGEQSNFSFKYCPNSNHCAKVILDARERTLGQSGDVAQTYAKPTRRPKSTKLKPAGTLKPKKATTPKTKEEIQHLGEQMLGQTVSKKRK